MEMHLVQHFKYISQTFNLTYLVTLRTWESALEILKMYSIFTVVGLNRSSIHERTTRQISKQVGYRNLRPAKNRKLRLVFAWDHQNWATEDEKNVAWSAES